VPFGQPTGPAASPAQVRDLLALLQAAGHVDFRDARGPLGFTQRQAAGRFTRDEVAGFIEQLQAAGMEGGEPVDARITGQRTGVEGMLRRLSDRELAEELERRGWVVIGP
jgi:hypothetical protein